MDPLELAVLALRLAMALVLYAFLLAVVRAARSALWEAAPDEADMADSSLPGRTAAPDRRVRAERPTPVRTALPLEPLPAVPASVSASAGAPAAGPGPLHGPSAAPAPASAWLYLRVVRPAQSGLAVGEYLEAADGAVLGRARDASLVVADPTVSSRHARFSRAASSWTVRDLGSTNGSYLNERRLRGEAPIGVGDVLRLGSVQLEVVREPIR